jgi:hypothetical protein
LGPAKINQYLTTTKKRKYNSFILLCNMDDDHPIPVADIHGHLAHYPGEEEQHHHGNKVRIV